MGEHINFLEGDPQLTRPLARGVDRAAGWCVITLVAHAPSRSSAPTAPTISGLTRAAKKAQWPLMMTITWVYAVLAIVLAANAVVAFEAIFRLEEPRGPR